MRRLVLPHWCFSSSAFGKVTHRVNVPPRRMWFAHIGKEFSQPSVVVPTSDVTRGEYLEKRIGVEPPFDRHQLIRSKCGNSHSPSDPSFARITRSDKMLNYLGFLLRSQSLFYCSVPKVATRTILPFMTYLHARDELLPALTNRSSVTHLQLNPDLKLAKTSGGFYASYVSRMLWNLTDVSRKKAWQDLSENERNVIFTTHVYLLNKTTYEQQR